MSNWHCYKCKVEVEEQDVDTEVFEQQLAHEGLVCPNCDEKWFSEDVVVDDIGGAEADAEAKMA